MAVTDLFIYFSCVESLKGNVMLFDVVVPELRFVALFTKCVRFGMLLCELENW